MNKDTILITILGVLVYSMIGPVNATKMNSKISSFLSTIPKRCNIIITSTKRSKEHNEKVGGAEKSLHITNKAADIVVSKECERIILNNAVQSGVTVIKYPNGKHLHLDVRDEAVCMVKIKSGYRFCEEGDLE